jgi:RNA polymerase sigma-70 factor (ECF subfamily)
LVRDHHEAVFRYAMRLTGQVADAEDLAQQAFLAAQVHLGQLRQPDRAGSWLLSIVRNCYLKNHHRRIPMPAGNLSLDVNTIVDRQPPGHQDHDEIDRERLQLALDELPSEFKVVVAMFYFEQCSYKEIAAQLELPIGTVMSRLSRAKCHLRSRLLEKNDRMS